MLKQNRHLCQFVLKWGLHTDTQTHTYPSPRSLTTHPHTSRTQLCNCDQGLDEQRNQVQENPWETDKCNLWECWSGLPNTLLWQTLATKNKSMTVTVNPRLSSCSLHRSEWCMKTRVCVASSAGLDACVWNNCEPRTVALLVVPSSARLISVQCLYIAASLKCHIK